MNKSLKSILNRSALFLIVLLGLWIIHSLLKAEYQNGDMSRTIYVGITTIIFYFGLVFLSSVLSRIRFFAYVNGFLTLPLLLYRHLVEPFTMSFIRMFTGALFLFIVLNISQLNLLPLMGLHLEDTTRLYCGLTATIIIYSLFGNAISFYTTKFLITWNSKEFERYSIIFDQNKFSYLIYVLAFLCLVGFTFCEFNNIEIESSMLTLRKVLLPTFATFVAWDRLISKSNLFKFNGVKDLLLSELLEQIESMSEKKKVEEKEKKVTA